MCETYEAIKGVWFNFSEEDMEHALARVDTIRCKFHTKFVLRLEEEQMRYQQILQTLAGTLGCGSSSSGWRRQELMSKELRDIYMHDCFLKPQPEDERYGWNWIPKTKTFKALCRQRPELGQFLHVSECGTVKYCMANPNRAQPDLQASLADEESNYKGEIVFCRCPEFIQDSELLSKQYGSLS